MNKIGLIGYGYWGKKLHEKIKKLSLDVEFICRSKDNYYSKLKDVDWVFVATTNQSHYEVVKKCLWAGKNVLLFGSEGFGLKSKTLMHSDFKYKVEMNKNMESLNISNTVSVVCHHIYQSIK